MTLKLLVLLLATMAVTMAQSRKCRNELSRFAECKSNQDGDKRSEKRDNREDRRERQMRTCFVKNGCEAPEDDDDEGRDCVKSAVKKIAAPLVARCLRSSGINVPQELFGMLMGGPGGRGGRGGPGGRGRRGRGGRGGRGGRVQNMADELCPNRRAAARAVACVEEKKEKREDRREERRGDREERSGCKELLSDECKDDIKEEACTCAQGLSAGQKRRLLRAVNKCDSGDRPNPNAQQLLGKICGERPPRRG